MIDTLRVDQALFGYSDGHHLLASSLRFGPRELERLLILSDIASNAASAGADGYWTGVPLADSEKYAFMRTWPAPEMSRPGCVWTHVIFPRRPCGGARMGDFGPDGSVCAAPDSR
jgi:hypothetical protein